MSHEALLLGVPPVVMAFPGVTDRSRALVTLPVHNEAPRLLNALEELDAAFRQSGLDYKLAVAEDGSTDGTKDLLKGLSDSWPGILVRSEARPLGRGLALRQLWSSVRADVYCFTDTDLAAGPAAAVEAVRRVMDGFPIVIGSRYTFGATTTRPPMRSLVSRGYNRLLRFGFRERIRDHQCGLKAFSASSLVNLLPYSREDCWYWDTEFVVLALRVGIPVLELPVTWVEKKTRRTPILRLLSDLYLHSTGIVRLKSRLAAQEPLRLDSGCVELLPGTPSMGKATPTPASTEASGRVAGSLAGVGLISDGSLQSAELVHPLEET